MEFTHQELFDFSDDSAGKTVYERLMNNLINCGTESIMQTEGFKFHLQHFHKRMPVPLQKFSENRYSGFIKRYGEFDIYLSITSDHDTFTFSRNGVNEKKLDKILVDEFGMEKGQSIIKQFLHKTRLKDLIVPGYHNKELFVEYVKSDFLGQKSFILRAQSGSLTEMVNKIIPRAVNIFNRVNEPHYRIEDSDVKRCVGNLINRTYGF